MKKNILFITLLLVVAISCSSFFYKNTRETKDYNIKINKNTPPITTESDNSNEIILGWSLQDKSSYTKLSENGKDIIKKYQEKVLERYGISDIPLESCYIKYNNKGVAFVGCPTGKIGFFFNLFDINKNDLIGEIIGINSSAESKDYIVFGCLDQDKKREAICYYKAGERKINTVSEASLEFKKDHESYVGDIGPGGESYDLKISRNILTAGVYDKRTSNNGLYKKLREVEFVLP